MTIPASSATARGRGQLAIRTLAAVLVIVTVTMTLARYNSIAKPFALMVFQLGGLIALGIVAISAAGMRQGRYLVLRDRLPNLAATGAALAFAGLASSSIWAAVSTPELYDVTTDLAHPPEFAVLPPRADSEPGVDKPGTKRALQAREYGDLQRQTVARPADQVARAALELAKASGWTVVGSDLANGRIEATDTVSYLRWHDDVIIQISPAANGSGAVVNMRSVSREGTRDFGRNAARIRAFLARLASTVAQS